MTACSLRHLTLLLIGLFTTNVYAAQLETSQVKEVTLPLMQTLDATIEAVHQATVSAQVQGRVTELLVDVDDYVTKDMVIVRFRDTEQRAAYNAAKARFDEAEMEFKRVKDIYEKKLVAKAALDRAEAQYKASRAALEQAREALDNTVVRAPYSGIVVKRHIEVGELARVGQSLMTGLSLEKLRAVVNLPQSLIHEVRAHQKAVVWVGLQRQQRITADSLTISPFADPGSHTFLVRVNLPDGDHKIYPGMHTKAAFVVGEVTRLVIPTSAVAHRSEVTAVYVQKPDKQLEFRYIRLGRQIDTQQSEVLAGLSAGETIVLDPIAAAATIHSAVK